MDRREVINKKKQCLFLKNMIKNMDSIELIDIYEESSEEISCYKNKMDEFLELGHQNKLEAIKVSCGYNDDYYFNWILQQVKQINSNDEWLIFKDEWWAKVKSNERKKAINDLWYHAKFSYGTSPKGYYCGFLAINISIDMIIDVGLYSDDEYNYQLSTMNLKS
ncbi:hypothetical protein [Clostridium sp. ZS1]|uniref:hypothetical protein n=1 Tax=Clostridium sp. ZS1 TaxID=2949989 RepID=UPI00207B0C93|nr:hypothetical protein [Clostridium sp. ZS1]